MYAAEETILLALRSAAEREWTTEQVRPAEQDGTEPGECAENLAGRIDLGIRRENVSASRIEESIAEWMEWIFRSRRG